MIDTVNLLGIKFRDVALTQALEEIAVYIPKKNGDFFCFLDMHPVVRAAREGTLKKTLNTATANFADGIGTSWALKFLGSRFKDKVRGTDMMLRLCAYAATNNLKVFLYGNTEDTLSRLRNKLTCLYPGINIIGAISPPFRELSSAEDRDIVAKINACAPDIIFISLGAPKQERWMASHKGKIQAVQLGVGVAFNYIAGTLKAPPAWLQKIGLEWLYRLPQQPQKVITRLLLFPEYAFRVLRQYFLNQFINR